MSNSLAIAAVTATISRLLDAGVNAIVPGTTVTAKPLDKARDNVTGNQINLFLYQAVPNPAWRNMDMPRQVQSGEIGQPPLPLNLFYLLTTYGRENDDVLAHELLGSAMGILYDHSVLGANEIQNALANNDLYLQVERVRITLQPLSIEDLSKLWAAFQSQYRISAAYQAAVVLIESTNPARAALPVLTRGPSDQGVTSQADLIPPFPTLTNIQPPNQQPAARLGDVLILSGFHLEGDNVLVRFTNSRLPAPIDVPPPPLLSRTSTGISVKMPDTGDDPLAPAKWPAGFYTLSAVIQRAGQEDRTTNELSFPLAPRITTALPISVARDPDGSVTLNLSCSPEVHPEQRVALLLGSREIVTQPHPTQTAVLTFIVPEAAPGDYFIRLRVDGVDSLLVNRSVTPPVFDTTQKVTVT